MIQSTGHILAVFGLLLAFFRFRSKSFFALFFGQRAKFKINLAQFFCRLAIAEINLGSRFLKPWFGQNFFGLVQKIFLFLNLKLGLAQNFLGCLK
jgi:hypothetical protein